MSTQPANPVDVRRQKENQAEATLRPDKATVSAKHWRKRKTAPPGADRRSRACCACAVARPRLTPPARNRSAIARRKRKAVPNRAAPRSRQCFALTDAQTEDHSFRAQSQSDCAGVLQ